MCDHSQNITTYWYVYRSEFIYIQGTGAEKHPYAYNVDIIHKTHLLS